MRRGGFAVLGLALLLGGCFVSDGPMIGASDYAYPLPNQANGDAYSFDRDAGQWKYDHGFSLRRAGAEYVLDDGDDATPFVLMAIGRDEWLAQNGTSDGRYQYGLLVRDGSTYYVYDLSDLCDALDDAGQRSYRVETTDDGDCVAHSQAGLIAAVRDKMPASAQATTSYVIR